MKRISKILIVCMVLSIFFINSCCFAKEKYAQIKTFTFRNDSSRAINGAKAEIYIGQKDFVEYQDDESIIITPTPDDVKTDDYGNMYAIYDFSSYKSGRTVEVTIERIFEPIKYSGEAIPVRTESSVNKDNQLYVKPQDKVESEDSTIIAKAKEITFGLSSDYKKAKAIFQYVNENITYDKTATYANKGAVSALSSSRGVCEEFATLYAALCRTLDIPCKIIEGYRINKTVDKEGETFFNKETGKYETTENTYKYSIVPHVWNEVYFDEFGWVPVDTCVMYITPNGDQVSSFDNFGYIDSEEYIAIGMYSKRSYEMAVYTEKFTLVDSKEEYRILESDQKEEVKHEFKDVDKYPWAVDAINTLYNMEIIKGYSDSEFGPSGNISRIEFIAMYSRLLRYLKYIPQTRGNIYYYLDYPENHYSKNDYDYLMRCLEDVEPFDRLACGYGAMSSIFGNSLNMDAPITRGEVVQLMGYFLKTKEIENANFSDIAGTKYEESILKAYSNGLMIGYEDGTFRPYNKITRAEMAVMLDRYVGVKGYSI